MLQNGSSSSTPRAVSGKRSERMRLVLSLLHERTSMSQSALAEALGISAATLRRDLADLDEQGLLVRTHGGARALDARSEIPVRLRNTQFREAKQLIARRAVDMIPAGPYAVALSGGTTTAEVARALSNRSGLTIVTNSLTIAMECAARPRLKVIMTGGVVRQSSFEAVGSLSENTFKAINVGTAILGTDGISVSGGVTTHDETEARTNHAMVANAQRVIVVADGSKVGQVTLAKMADLSEIDDFVTDSDADPAALQLIADVGVTVHIVDLSAVRR
ncbi:DeoR/GlpR transcriptional regulator [Cryobacterium algoricola]|uniref:DeoR/GlpR family DNA-binding transcription regulator n=2 Tax=Cryobacterium TaxID=69578 RepID=A0AA41UE79_9MICO|nr:MULTISPECIES: DeoR/GlpR family DNA-binding transcription regulator [Cryobacterium]MCI4656750.1 DeoR/GlpR family DNA-binding transcription regulator [Cryobacterium zhongshanensis]TFB85288.1 DeoR/GlpR transcriptional regulator [Cryobacterium algoricola]